MLPRGNLWVDYYDYLSPPLSTKEISHYQELLKQINGPILEAMCGSGRFLIPMNQAGFKVDGVDLCEKMLTQCHEKVIRNHLTSSLFEADITHMQLNKKYQAIIIVGASFQLIHPRATATTTLLNLKKHLVPGGKIFFEINIPVEILYKELYQHTVEVLANDCIIRVTILNNKINKIEQHYKMNMRYEKICDDVIVQSETITFPIQWYYKYEFQMLLEQAGFHSISIIEDGTTDSGKFMFEASSE